MKRTFLILLATFLYTAAFSQLNSSNLPIIVINTSGIIFSDFKVDGDMGIIYNGEGVRNNITNPFNHYSGKIGIEVRGQSSQSFPMKSYNVELRTDEGEERKASFFGMPEESDWVLYAPYTDKTLMRNFLAYTLSNEMGHWASHCRFVELKVNGDYKGIYVLMEKIKRSEGRLNLSDLNPDDVADDQLTGGYIFSVDKQPNGWYSSYQVPNTTDGGRRQYSFVFPKVDEIVFQQKNYLKSVVDKFEQVAASDYFQDPVKGLDKYIDYSSFVDYHIIDEISRNVDGYRFSTYFHKNKDSKNSKIIAGPVWDFDIAFHNANYCNGELASGWALDYNYDCMSEAASSIPFFWYKMAREDSIFKNILHCHWNSYRKNIINEEHLFHLIDSIALLTEEARGRHFARWPILGTYVWPNPQPVPSDYPGEIAQLKEWLQARIEWLDNNMPQSGRCWPDNAGGTFISSVYPNPLSSNNTVKIISQKSQFVNLQYYNSMGKLMYQAQQSLIEGENYFYNLNTTNWPKGVYYFRCINTSGEIHSQKLIK